MFFFFQYTYTTVLSNSWLIKSKDAKPWMAYCKIILGFSPVLRVGLGELHLFLLKIKQNTALLCAFIPEAAKFGAEQKDSLSEMLK